jgi:galacturan 1,4-alpha-galacturonidase
VDIYPSSFVTVHDMRIDNGDDSVSFKPKLTVSNLCSGLRRQRLEQGWESGDSGRLAESKMCWFYLNLDIPRLMCGGKDIVSNVYVNNVTIRHALNGLRVKTWGGQGVSFVLAWSARRDAYHHAT